MLLLIIFAFIAGFVTVLSPCILPVLPIVLSGSVGGGHRRPLGIVTGFILSFTLFTLFLSAIVKATGISADVLRSFSVVIVILFGVSLLLPQFQVLMEKLFTRLSSLVSNNSTTRESGFGSGILLGMSLGLVWTPCVGPIIASVITLAASNSVNGSAFLITLAYSLGTAIPMFAITYGGRKLLQKVPWLLKNTGTIQKTFGVIMILVAIAIFFNLDRQFQTVVLDKFPQYGAGLTKLEDNNFVKKSLESLRAPSFDSNALDKPMGDNKFPQAPELILGGKWFNTQPLSIQGLSGKVVLIDFWTYSCINCLRTLPYVKDWNEKYNDKGLVIIGVHTPEFEFEKNEKNVAKAIEDLGITYPVMQDNEFATWNAYSNRYWPAHYLIDRNGLVRESHFGEGDYDKTEEYIQKLLKETGAKVNEKINTSTYKIDAFSPETYLGYARLGAFASPQEPTHDKKATYSFPESLPLNSFAYKGSWNIGDETAMAYTNSALEYHFKAKEVYLVINMGENEGKIKVYLDGKLVDATNGGEDVQNGMVNVNRNGLYKLIRLPKAEDHILRLEFLDDNSSVFAFTFG